MKPCSVDNLNGFIGFFIILVFQSQPFYGVKWLTLARNRADIAQ